MKIMHFQTRLYLLKKVDGSIYHKVFEFAMCFGTIASVALRNRSPGSGSTGPDFDT